MCRFLKYFFHLTVLTILSISNPAQALDISIESPTNKSEVGWRQQVSGKVAGTTTSIWVVVRPLDSQIYWVQPRAEVDRNGHWIAIPYFGENRPEHKGKLFAIRAFANPMDSLSEGQQLSQWPRAGAFSEVIQVTRK